MTPQVLGLLTNLNYASLWGLSQGGLLLFVILLRVRSYPLAVTACHPSIHRNDTELAYLKSFFFLRKTICDSTRFHLAPQCFPTLLSMPESARILASDCFYVQGSQCILQVAHHGLASLPAPGRNHHVHLALPASPLRRHLYDS